MDHIWRCSGCSRAGGEGGHLFVGELFDVARVRWTPQEGPELFQVGLATFDAGEDDLEGVHGGSVGLRVSPALAGQPQCVLAAEALSELLSAPARQRCILRCGELGAVIRGEHDDGVRVVLLDHSTVLLSPRTYRPNPRLEPAKSAGSSAG